MNKLIAIVEDEPDILELVSLSLQQGGFRAESYADASSFFRSLDKKRPDLVILDLMLPDADGLDVCKSLRMNERTSAIPIVMLTAKAEETDKVLGLELGADDYITKPFSPKELLARVKAVLRRTEAPPESKEVRVGRHLGLNADRHEVLLDGRPVALTLAEFKILWLLASKAGRVFTREQILDHLWGGEKAVVDRTVDVHIRNLRDKLGEYGTLIVNIRGLGYKIEEGEAASP
jgi:two-component system phosphate regulon response regulator PhoB/two-component system alkaline phosphatase synthesis response regulator PhoP